jgi:hypothetical protein
VKEKVKARRCFLLVFDRASVLGRIKAEPRGTRGRSGLASLDPACAR